MIDLLSAQVLFLTDSAQSLPASRGGTCCAARETLGRFFARLMAAQIREAALIRTPAAREVRIRAAVKELADAGI